VLRRTRSSHPWALTTRHPWRVTVRRNTPPPPPDVEFPPFIEKHCPLRGNRCIEHCHWNGLSIRSACPSRRRSPNEVARSSSFGWRRFGAPDHHAPWMARGERPWMARACPAHRTSVTRTPSEVGTRSSEPMSNAPDAFKRYRFSCYGPPVTASRATWPTPPPIRNQEPEARAYAVSRSEEGARVPLE